MADYTNYAIVSWTDTTPITSVRLNQMSTNIEEVKIANDDKPKGIVRYKITSPSIASNSGTENDAYKLIALELSGGDDTRVTLDPTRHYRFTIALPGITQTAPSAEDGYYVLRIREGNVANTGTVLTEWQFSPTIAAFWNGQDGTITVNTDISIRANITFGAGTYTHMVSGLTKTNQAYLAELQRVNGPTQTSNLPEWSITGGSLQFYVEDIGGVA